MADVLVYRGWGPSGYGVFGHVLGSSYTYQISSVQPNWVNISNAFSSASGGFVFRGTDTNGSIDGLVFSDGTGSTNILVDSNGNAIGDPTAFSKFGNESVFLASTSSVSGSYPPKSLMITNGSGAPIPVVPFPVEFYKVVGSTIYAKDDATNDLYKIDANLNATLIYDRSADPTPMNIDYLFEFAGALYFRGDEGSVNDFYRVDPTTNQITAIGVGVNSGGDTVRFSEAGIVGNKFYFWNTGGGIGNELYVTDGTSGGTSLVKDIRAGSLGSYVNTATTGSNSLNTASLGNKLIFMADDGGVDNEELWITDGTGAGTVRLSGSGSTVGALSLTGGFRILTVGNQVFFRASRADTGYELYVTDGTAAGTRLVKDIRAGTSSSDPDAFFTDGTYLYFGVGSADGEEDAVWRSDGTAAGTFEISDPGTNFNPAEMFAIHDLDVGAITGSPLDDMPVCTALDDIVFGFAGNDTLDGLAGADTLDGGLGNDTYVVDNVGDMVVERDNEGIDTVQSFISYSLGRGLDKLELLGTLGLTAVGNLLDNTLIGNPGSNVINGMTGSDTINGGAGNDVLDGGPGSNAINGGSGWDKANYAVASTAATITRTGNGTATISGAGFSDTLTGVEVAHFLDRDIAIREATRSDTNGNGTSDMVLQSGGTVVAWNVSNGVAQSGTLIGGGVDGWTVQGTGDFNGDGTTDVILQNGGTVVQWSMNNGANAGGTLVGAGIDGWTVKGTGDFNSDGTTDVVLQNGGTVVAWTMQNGVAASGVVVGSGVAGWDVVGTGDFNGDGASDILLQNGGTLVAWNMRNGQNIGGSVLAAGIDGWQVVGTGDFNGDGTTDVVVKNGGTIVDLLVQNSVATTGNVIGLGLEAWDVVATGDYNGDGTADIALTSGGIVVDWSMQNGLVTAGNVLGGNGTFSVVA